MPIWRSDSSRNTGRIQARGRARHARAEGYQKTGNRAGQARSLSGIAWNYALLGQLDAALKFGEKSLSLHRELGNQHGEADVLCTLAYRQYLLGDKARAIAGCTRALELWYRRRRLQRCGCAALDR